MEHAAGRSPIVGGDVMIRAIALDEVGAIAKT